MKKSMRVALGLCTTTVVLATTLGMPLASGATGAAGAAGVPRMALTDLEIGTMAPAAQAALLDPLRAVAGALSEVGGGVAADVFTSVEIDANHGVVNLYLTDTSRAAGVIQTAKSASPSIDTSLVRVHKATHTRAAMDRARDSYLAEPHRYAVYAVSVAPDGSGLEMEVGDPTAAVAADRNDVALRSIAETRDRSLSAAFGASMVPRSFVKGSPRQSKSDAWNKVKWHDHAPFIGGDVITNGRTHCTTGLPAVRKSDGRPVMVTAAHCFKEGTRVYTGAGQTWGWSNGLLGSYVGTVTARNRGWDAATLVGANNNADESDVDRWIPLTSVKYSFRGDWVCHSGAKSAYRGHSTPCGIKVTNQDFRWRSGPFVIRGVEGVDVLHGWGCVNGDSGATVWAITSNANARQARGIISDGGKDGTPDQKRLDWTEAVDIFNFFGLKLNPVK